MRTIAIQTITLFLATMLFVSCREDAEVNTDIIHSGIKVALTASNPTGAEGGTAGTSLISNVSVYLFRNGVLAEILDGLVPDVSGIYLMSFKKQEGRLYCLANVPETVTAGHFTIGTTSLNDFLLFTASDTEMISGDYIAMSGYGDINQNQTTSRIQLKRGVARVDLSTSLKDVQIHRVKVNRIADRGFLNPQQDNITPQETQYKDSLFLFPKPLVDITRTLTYLCEQQNTTLEFEIYASSGGVSYKMKARLPDKIVRNTVYTLDIRSNGSKLDVEVKSADWNYGTITESNLELANLINVEESTLPQGVRINDTHDTLYVSFRQNIFDLALSVAEGSHVEVNGKIQGVTTTILLPTLNAPQHTVHVSITKSAKLIKTSPELEEVIYLDVFIGDKHAGRIVLIFESHPVLLTGLLDFRDTPEFDFGNYTDGELGELTLPDGWTASCSVDANEPWMKLMPAAENSQKIRILAGWRPNDPHADGRVQEAKFILSDGTNTETYTVKRRNWGLPVVNIGGTWWCKYNLRGKGTDFTNQILPSNDPHSENDLYEYLKTCPEDELLDLLGHQYQVGFAQGFPLVWNTKNSVFCYEGLSRTAPNIDTIENSEMIPPGYRMPRRNDYRALSYNENYDLGGSGATRTYTSNGKTVNSSVSIRNVSFLGHSYGYVGIYQFQVGDGKIVLCGLNKADPQVDNGNPVPMCILLTTVVRNNSWEITGIANGDQPPQENRFRYVDQRWNRITRVLRCIKSTVEYTY